MNRRDVLGGMVAVPVALALPPAASDADRDAAAIKMIRDSDKIIMDAVQSEFSMLNEVASVYRLERLPMESNADLRERIMGAIAGSSSFVMGDTGA
jgi:hypothetical protein